MAKPRPNPQLEYVLPDSVKLRAIEHGERAERAFVATWQAEQKAYRNEAAKKRPAAWLVEDPCPAWCVGGENHANSTHPDDRVHFSYSAITPLVTMAYEAAGHPDMFMPPELTVSLDLAYRERDPRVTISADDGATTFKATLAEAEKVALDILRLVAEARGQTWRPVVTPFDEQGRCQDTACGHCYGQSEVQA
ncbi:DUF6907 domain-containing protein [Nonomuraea sp. bgisy101]|uniref:DUF6907 domain-containing protein n=1 Tax=Nonomuraea sp. bgisy101 TaxID=3413784 RepID=UPI003D75BB98